MRNLKSLTVLFAFVFGVSMMSAQAFQGSGDKKLQVGFAPYGHGTGLSGTFDFGVHQNFSLGFGGEFYFSDHDHHDDFYIFGRANAHLGTLLNMPSSMDLYPGIDLGLIGNDFGFGGHLGFRYFFQNNLGVYIEVGSRGSLGLSFNL